MAFELTLIPWFMDIGPRAHTRPSIHIESVWLMELYSYAHDYMVKSDQPKPLFTNPFDSCLVPCISEVRFAFFVFSLLIYLMCHHLLLQSVNHRVSPPLFSCSHLLSPPPCILSCPFFPLGRAQDPITGAPSAAWLNPRRSTRLMPA